MSGIEWTDRSIGTLVAGCSPAGAGCLNCWAAATAWRFFRRFDWYPDDVVEMGPNGPRWTGKVVPLWDRIEPVFQGLPKRKPAKVFVDACFDLFHEDLPESFVWRVLNEIDRLPLHTFIVLTKRTDRLYQLVETQPEPLPRNLWILGSASTQEEADEATRNLRKVGARVRGLSLEPLVEPVRLESVTFDGGPRLPLEWYIVGAESLGPRAGRACGLRWIQGIVDQCRAASVPCFVKQIHLSPKWIMRRTLSHNPADWPPDLRVQEFPEVTQ